MEHEAGILADGSTMAVGWILMAGLRRFRSRLRTGRRFGLTTATVQQAASDHRLACDLFANVRLAQHASGIAAPHKHIDLDPKLVAGRHWSTELRTLDASEQEQLVLAVREFDQQQHSAGLRH